jgi:predicted molibdopterin-dependent oxidoreductase YjgC
MNIRIDGRAISFDGQPTILDVARANGIFIPSLCDHPRLDPFAACRLCLVEIAGRNVYAPACSTPAEDGLEVSTATPGLVEVRRRTLELILAEHPNACLICAEMNSCDEFKATLHKTGEINGCVFCPVNGRCDLQSVVEAVGVERVHFPTERRPGEIRRDDPFIDRDNSLCILCGRCVRICEEVRGASVLTFIGRGSETVIGTAMDRRLVDSGCRFCGACVDVCPTASLSERAARYESPPAEEAATICAFCGQGCALKVGSRGDRIVSARPDSEGPANRGQACVRGRFLVRFAVDHPDRIRRPMIRREGVLIETTWEEALSEAAERLTAAGPGHTAMTISGQVSCEDLFVLHKFGAGVLKAGSISGPWEGSAAGKWRDLISSDGRSDPLNFGLSEIGRASTIVLIGEDVTITQPILGVEIAQALKNGAEVVSVDPEGIPLAHALKTRSPALFIFGPELLKGPKGPARLAALRKMAVQAGGRVIALDREANVRGGLEISRTFAPVLKPGGGAPALYIAGGFPRIERGAAETVVVQGSYMDENAASADIVFPETTSFEAEGTFVNVEGRAQLSGKALAPRAEARPGWVIAAALATKMGGSGFAFQSAVEVRKEMARTVPSLSALGADNIPPEGIFLSEDKAPAASSDRGQTLYERGADDYKGLDMALKNKSLRLIRGR